MDACLCKIIKNEKLLLSFQKKYIDLAREILDEKFIEIGSTGKIYNKCESIESSNNQARQEIECQNLNVQKIADNIVY